jgi:hypothetical protein
MSDTPSYTAPFITEHLEAFRASEPRKLDRNVTGGKIPRRLAEKFPDADYAILPDETITHDEVVALVQGNHTTITVCAAILAWGDMRYDNRNFLLKSTGSWVNECEKIRDGTYSRVEAFAALKKLRDGKDLKGLGCAYFTKLIYFLQFSEKAKKPEGYIMDQWASESINVLTGKNIVKLDSSWSTKWTSGDKGKPKFSTSSIASDKNDASDYEAFCLAMDKLAVDAAIDPEKRLTRPELDRGVMGGSKDKKICWREYLLAYRKGQCFLKFEHG